MKTTWSKEAIKLKNFLDRLSKRHWSIDGHNQIFWGEEEYTATPLSADEWQRFKRDFVEEYGGETVKPTGMTNSELLDYIATSTRDGNDDEDFLIY